MCSVKKKIITIQVPYHSSIDVNKYAEYKYMIPINQFHSKEDNVSVYTYRCTPYTHEEVQERLIYGEPDEW